MSDNSPGFIVVEGPIGVGKTSLARLLAKTFGSELLLERAEENPFLPRFYEDPRRGALPTQLFFLFQRARQLEELKQGDMFKPVRVADFMLEKDRLFAGITLDDDELRLYEQAYRTLALESPQPDLVIYLQAPLDVLQARIAKRGIQYELLADADYLQQVVEAYTGFFYHYSDAPLLIVNAADIDFVNNPDDFRLLLEQVKNIRSGRHYFNPVPVTL